MATQTILWIPTAHRRYAQENGAKYDAKQSVWYVDGAIPAPLADYVALAPRARDYTKETVPNCPACGHAMVWINSNKPFWGCSDYKNSGCSGSRQGDYLLHSRAAPVTAGTVANNATSTSTFVRSIHLTRILSLLHRCLDREDRVLIWLNENRVEFRGKNALELMGTTEGLRLVEKFIVEAFRIL